MVGISESVTGAHQLRLADLVGRLGLMADSSQCCATGTCPVMLNGASGPEILETRDRIDAQDLQSKFGRLM